MVQSVAIIGAGSMGSGIGAALHRHGVEVCSPLTGRSPASWQRALDAGIVDAGPAALGAVDVILSIVPPGQAVAVAQDLLPVLADAARKPVYVDCNAISPEDARAIGAMVAATGARFVDGGIIGLPPGTGGKDPMLYLSGSHAEAVARLGERGLQLAIMRDMPIGAASALKLAYAGVTKGLIALGASMALAAEDAGVSSYFRAELARSQPQLSLSFSRTMPDMLGKAARWVAEMGAIAEFSDYPIHRPMGELFGDIASDERLQERLRQFYDQRS